MKQLSIALITKFSALTGSDHDLFYASTHGHLYKGRAPQEAQRPYATYNIISNVPDYNFTSNLETTRIQFDLYSDKESSSEIEDMFTYLKGMFDWCTLPLSGNLHVYMKRILANLVRDPSDDGWHYIVDYEIMTEHIPSVSKSHSPSLSPSTSPSASPSLSPSASESPSASPSASPSI
jgi:hypothetical protein